MSNAIDPNNPAIEGNTMTDGDFERLLDELHGDGAPQAIVDLEATTAKPSVDRSVLNNTLKDEDFERLLAEQNETDKKADAEVSEPANGANSSAEPVPVPVQAPVEEDPNTITDDEFERLLDDLHGEGGAPAAIADAQAGVSDDADPVVVENGASAVASENDLADDCVALMLDPTMVIAQAAVFHERLCSLVEEEQMVGVDASEVNVIDTANLQLLYAFMRDRNLCDRRTVILKPTESFVSSAESLGIGDYLNLRG